MAVNMDCIWLLWYSLL